jgi:hypothetical protein
MTERMCVMWQLANAFGRRSEMNLGMSEEMRPKKRVSGNSVGGSWKFAYLWSRNMTNSHLNLHTRAAEVVVAVRN